MFLFILLKSTEEQKRYRQNLFEYYSIFVFIFTTVVQNIDNIDLKFNLGLASHKFISKPDHKTYGKNPTMEETLLLKRSPPPPPGKKYNVASFPKKECGCDFYWGGGGMLCNSSKIIYFYRKFSIICKNLFGLGIKYYTKGTRFLVKQIKYIIFLAFNLILNIYQNHYISLKVSLNKWQLIGRCKDSMQL